MGLAVDTVNQAANPRAALLALAALIDSHEKAIGELTAIAASGSEWDSWGEDNAPTTTVQAINVDGNSVDVQLLVADETVQQERREWAEEHLDLPDDVLDAFAKCGAQYLYLYDPEFVRSMPDDWKVWMVADVQRYSEPEALEMSRDILKDTGTGFKPDAVARQVGS